MATERTLRERNAARHRQYHARRTLVKQAFDQGSRLAVDRMTDEALAMEMHAHIVALVTEVSGGASPDLARIALNLEAVYDEWARRGDQLRLC